MLGNEHIHFFDKYSFETLVQICFFFSLCINYSYLVSCFKKVLNIYIFQISLKFLFSNNGLSLKSLKCNLMKNKIGKILNTIQFDFYNGT